MAVAMNKELGNTLHIARNHDSSSHMWNSGTLAMYLDFLKEDHVIARVCFCINPFVNGHALPSTVQYINVALYLHIFGLHGIYRITYPDTFLAAAGTKEKKTVTGLRHESQSTHHM